MNLRSFYLVAGIVLVVEIGVGLWGLGQVPPDALVPIHWGISGEADGFATPLVAFSLVPVLTLAMVGLFALIPRIEPRRENLERSAGAFRTVAIAVIVMLGVIQVVVVAAGVGAAGLPVGLVVGASVGALFAVIGNVMGTVRSNYLFGVRTPWTLASDLAWARTNRAVGRLFVGLGIALVLVSISGSMELVFGLILGGVVAILVVSFGYSYLVWKADPDRRDREHAAP
jgi:uncharacterized membrane protein